MMRYSSDTAHHERISNEGEAHKDIVVGGGADFVIWIDYLIHIQNSIGDTRIGLVFSEDEKTPPYGDRQNRVI